MTESLNFAGKTKPKDRQSNTKVKEKLYYNYRSQISSFIAEV